LDLVNSKQIKNQPITAPTRKWGGCGFIKHLCI
jgi:hypothetical protein